MTKAVFMYHRNDDGTFSRGEFAVPVAEHELVVAELKERHEEELVYACARNQTIGECMALRRVREVYYSLYPSGIPNGDPKEIQAVFEKELGLDEVKCANCDTDMKKFACDCPNNEEKDK